MNLQHHITLNLTVEAAAILLILAEEHESKLKEQFADGDIKQDAATHMTDVIDQLNKAFSVGANIVDSEP